VREWSKGSGVGVADCKTGGARAEAPLGCRDVQRHEVICLGGE